MRCQWCTSRRPRARSPKRSAAAARPCSAPSGRSRPRSGAPIRISGCTGAFGYDLAFQFEPVRARIERPDGQRDMVLHLPNGSGCLTAGAGGAVKYQYEFAVGDLSTSGLPRETADTLPEPVRSCRWDMSFRRSPFPAVSRPWSSGPRRASRGVTCSRSFLAMCFTSGARHPRTSTSGCACGTRPRTSSCSISVRAEYLVGASPEMYVRVTGDRVETCPISGTIARGEDTLEDAENIGTLLGSAKEESELTMCTDVDRNDKSRVCVPGTVRVIGRRQIEMYSRVIHTVDHIEGRLRPGRRPGRVSYPYVGGHRHRRAQDLGDAVHRG